ncbi:MAG: DUF4835 family protein [Bacteroidetes bacterium]|nr:DUF4835 family protein [Bacteroidota bacterium]
MKRNLFLLLFIIASITCFGQELLCNVSVIAPKENLADKKTLKGLENSIREFMNNSKWSENSYNTNERIECALLFTITAVNNGVYTGSLQVTSSRPIFGTSYSTSMINYLDKTIEFAYTEFSPLQYMKGTYTSELTALLAFYAYYIIAVDNDSYSYMGGTPQLNEAVNISNQAQSSTSPGWKSTEKNDRNRYYLLNAITDDRNKDYRAAWYNYHRQGFDLMQQDVEKGRENVMKSLETLKTMHDANPFNLAIIQFFMVKPNELMNLFANAPTSQKQKALQILPDLDPLNANKYQEKIKE